MIKSHVYYIMIRESHTNASLKARLNSLLNVSDIDVLLTELSTFSNSQFRTAGYILAEDLLLHLPFERFCFYYKGLVWYNSRAFLVTLTKSLAKFIRQNSITISTQLLADISENFNELDAQKFLQIMLPDAADAENVKLLMSVLKTDDIKLKISVLLKVDTLPSMFVLFGNLRQLEHNHDFLVKITYFLIKRGDSTSFNLACLVREYFGLDEVKGTFSLSLKPYQLARLELSYEAFCEVMRF